MKTVEDEFVNILTFMGIPNDKIRNEASFIKDYDFDESQFICLALYLGIFFKINVRECEYTEFDTVETAINFVKRKLKLV